MENQLDPTQRNLIGEKVFELANLSVVALVITQLLNSRIVPVAMATGFVLFFSLYMIAMTIMKGGDR